VPFALPRPPAVSDLRAFRRGVPPGRAGVPAGDGARARRVAMWLRRGWHHLRAAEQASSK